MKEIWKKCEEELDEMQKELQDEIEKVIEEVTQQKFEKIAEVKADYEFILKRLEASKNKEKVEQKKQERE